MGMTNKPELLRHVINQYLEEQEALYNKIDYVGDIILETKDRDHVVFTYNSETQFKEIVNAFIRRGINHNQIGVLLIFTKEQQKFIESMDKIENVNFLFNSQDIVIIPADECFSDDDSFSIMPSLNSMRNIVELAKQKSKNGLNVLATLPSKLIEQGRYEDALQLENVSNEAIKGFEMPITVLCLYKAVPENLEDRFSQYHDLIVKRATLSQGLQ
jgi:hypothetical protein